MARRGHPRSSAERTADHARFDGAALEAAARRHLQGPPIAVLVGDAKVLRPVLAAALPGRPLRIFDDGLKRAD
jgi:hypothetical protein